MSASYTIIIPARYASTRLPGKPLLDIHGKPLIQHVYEACCATSAGNIWIATDDERIAEAATAFGAEAVMTSSKHESGTDRLAEMIKLKQLADDEIIVNVQGDEYGLPPQLIEQVANGLNDNPTASVATLCEAINDEQDYLDPNVVKVVFDRNHYALYFSRSPLPAHRAGGMPDSVYRHIGLYAYRAGYLCEFSKWPPGRLEQNEALEQLRVLEHGDRIYVAIASAESGVGIDTAADLEKVRAVKKSN